jgi:adenylate cyclase
VSAGIAALGNSGELASADHLQVGIGLHVGEVMYGNVGGGERLDFTCIGAAVNLAGRLEKLAGALGRTMVASHAFAVHCGNSLASLGHFELAGIVGTRHVFAVAE